MNPEPRRFLPDPEPLTRNPKPYTLNHAEGCQITEPLTAKPQSLNPKLQTLNHPLNRSGGMRTNDRAVAALPRPADLVHLPKPSTLNPET